MCNTPETVTESLKSISARIISWPVWPKYLKAYLNFSTRSVHTQESYFAFYFAFSDLLYRDVCHAQPVSIPNRQTVFALALASTSSGALPLETIRFSNKPGGGAEFFSCRASFEANLVKLGNKTFEIWNVPGGLSFFGGITSSGDQVSPYDSNRFQVWVPSGFPEDGEGKILDLGLVLARFGEWFMM